MRITVPHAGGMGRLRRRGRRRPRARRLSGAVGGRRDAARRRWRRRRSTSAADYALQWRYQLGGGEIDGPRARRPAPRRRCRDDAAGRRARRRPPARRARRARCRSPSRGRWTVDPDVLVVDLWALGPVYVAARRAPLRASTGAHPPSALVPLLSAADALPPGIAPRTTLRHAEVADGELAASLPAPLVAWAAGERQAASPRVGGRQDRRRDGRDGRVRVQLDGALDWTLEVADGAVEPASGRALDVDHHAPRDPVPRLRPRRRGRDDREREPGAPSAVPGAAARPHAAADAVPALRRGAPALRAVHVDRPARPAVHRRPARVRAARLAEPRDRGARRALRAVPRGGPAVRARARRRRSRSGSSSGSRSCARRWCAGSTTSTTASSRR